MDKKLKLLPKGMSSFEVMRKGNYLYVDKTEQIYNLITQDRYCFLSRPRRFGKSLLVSTLKALFEGKKELFEGLWIASSDYEWKPHPVIYFNLFSLTPTNAQELEAGIGRFLHEQATLHSINLNPEASLRENFATIIKKLAEKNSVVVLIDEYDYPILANIGNKLITDECRIVLQNFYGTLKSLDSYLRFVFLTGVTKFAKTSIFSGLNNINDLTMDEAAATLLGYTHAELINNFEGYIKQAALKLDQSSEQIVEKMTEWYNGYQFSQFAAIKSQSAKVYNPYSILLFLSKSVFSNYWFETGSPRFLIEVMMQQNFQPIELNNLHIGQDQIGAFEVDKIFLPTLLYQTGYLTIESFDSEDEHYKLRIPNLEVEKSLFKQLLINCTPLAENAIGPLLSQIRKALQHKDIDAFCEVLQGVFASIPSSMHSHLEKYYQSIIFVITKLAGFETIGEDSTNLGRIDMVAQTSNTIFIMEFKTRGSAQEALSQIEEKKYAQKYLVSGKRSMLAGIFIDVEKRNIDSRLTKTI